MQRTWLCLLSLVVLGCPAKPDPPATGPATATLLLRRTGRARILCLGLEDKPASDFSIRVQGPAEIDGRSSDARGEILLEDLPPGSFTLRHLHDRYPSCRVSFVVEEGRTSEVTVRLEAGAVLAGRVLTQTGEPIAGAFVTANPRRGAA